jgi:hypothetical protein
MPDTAIDVHRFAQFFPEWALSWSLRQATYQDSSQFWNHAKYVTPVESGKELLLSNFFRNSTAPVLKYERSFLKTEAPYFGIDEETYRKTFWSLRPDFVAESHDASVFLILEAKGGPLSDTTWKNPKELLYQRFLQASTIPRLKGLFYIIPRSAFDDCARCLTETFATDESITKGILIWENLLPVIYDQLIGTALDQVIKEMKGLEVLRSWQTSRGKTTTSDA